MPGRPWEARALQDALVRDSRPVVRPGGLSERELELALLVGRALTNQQIAEHLVLSVRTVESHVRNALTKLDLISRTQLAVWVHAPPGQRPPVD